MHSAAEDRTTVAGKLERTDVYFGFDPVLTPVDNAAREEGGAGRVVAVAGAAVVLGSRMPGTLWLLVVS